MKIIPAIDLIEGRCVRLLKGNFANSKQYSNTPLEMSKMFEDAGVKYLHLVDLDGARTQKVHHWNVLEEIASTTSLNIDFSGGLRTKADLQRAFDAGARQVVIGSQAHNQPDEFAVWLDTFGPDKVVLAVDIRNGEIAIKGWQEDTGKTMSDVLGLYVGSSLKHIMSTAIAKDGGLSGPDFTLYNELCTSYPQFNWIASGGVGTSQDLLKLQSLGLHGAIVGKAIYEGMIPINEIAQLC